MIVHKSNDNAVKKLHIRRFIAAMTVFALAVILPFRAACASSDETQQSGDWRVYIADGADLLTDIEEEELFGVMKPGTEYGNMVFVTITDAVGYNSSDYIEMLYQTTDVLKGTDAVIYIIDMDNRLLWISGYGSLKKVITPDYGNLITDNIYTYASDGDYARCAKEGYRQIVAKLEGQRIAGPLRTAGNFSIALMLAAVLTFLFAYITSASRKAKDADILNNIERRINMTNPNIVHTTTKKIYDPPSSSSSGGGGGFRSSGGGGGFHGGGGGHGF